MNLRGFIRDIPDFPKAGIVFKDITPLLLDAGALDAAVSSIAAYARPLSDSTAANRPQPSRKPRSQRGKK